MKREAKEGRPRKSEGGTRGFGAVILLECERRRRKQKERKKTLFVVIHMHVETDHVQCIQKELCVKSRTITPFVVLRRGPTNCLKAS